MDITMKRQDYIKFCEVFPKETTELDLVTIYTEEWWNSLITRVVNGKEYDLMMNIFKNTMDAHG